MIRSGLVAVAITFSAHAAADELPTLAGPAMGTTYRVTLAADVPGVPRGEVHREIETVLTRLDRAMSTWRHDSDVSRFNQAAAGEWVSASADLVTIVEIARRVHSRSSGAFDITVAPLLRVASGSEHDRERTAALARVGMKHVESRPSPPALRKTVAGVEIDLGGIGPGYAVDCIGARLMMMGSHAHLVELGGEVRAWGSRPDGSAWRVRLRDAGRDGDVMVELASGEAIATATARPGKSPIDPRSGRVVESGRSTATVRGASCAEADAVAVARLIMGEAAVR